MPALPLRVAVVGLGWWGRIICGLLKGNTKLSLATAVDVDPVGEGFCRGLGISFSKDFPETIRRNDIQGVILCTPHTQHCGQIVKAAAAKKHVFCEKPLSLSRADVLKAVEACNANGVALAVGHERRFEPPMLELQRMAKAGELGTILQIEANFSQNKFLELAADNWRLSGKEAPAGPMTATGIHLLDLSIAFLGPVKTAYAQVATLGSQLTNGDTLGVMLSHVGGGHSLISAMLATPFEGRFAVYGTGGWAEVRDKTHPEASTGWGFTFQPRNGEKRTKEYPAAKAVLENLEAFADASLGRAAYPVPQAQMIANISALEAVFKSAASGAPQRVEN